MPSLNPNTFPEQRGVRAAEYAIRQSVNVYSGDGTKQITDNEVAKIFAAADQYMPNGKKVSEESSLDVALKILEHDVTKEGIDAIFKRFGIEVKPEDPVVEPDPGGGGVIMRPRYGLMETARPIIERTNAGASEEDVARLKLLRALADRSSRGDEASTVRGRAAFNMPSGGVRSLGGQQAAMVEVRTTIDQALARCGVE